ncbi:MAG: hypothetical protein EXS05_06245 [Planctomycetaceae bacterium]|nr:hypothetical protein [Planctomycetaceae bacterium]
MKLVEINWNPAPRQLRQFGLIALAVLPAAGWFWSGGNQTVTFALGAVGLVLALLAVVSPRALRPVFVALTIVAFPIGIVVSELALLLIFFGIFLPIGIAFRLARRDGLQLKLDRTRGSYWRPKKQSTGAAGYYRQS